MKKEKVFIAGHKGEIIWDDSKPDGTPRKLLDVSKMHAAGWYHTIGLEEGIKETYRWFLQNTGNLKRVQFQVQVDGQAVS